MKDSNKALFFTAIAIAGRLTVASAFKIALRHYTHSGASLSELGIGLAFFSAFLWALFWIVSRGNRQIDNEVWFFVGFFFGVIYLAVISFFVFVDLGSVNARC